MNLSAAFKNQKSKIKNPTVALVGRPNVGKSTLFNRITRSRQALVDDFPGVTRDRHYAEATIDDVTFTLIDTGGFISTDEDYFASRIKDQVIIAAQEADVIVLILDGRAGLTPYDRELADIIRRMAKPVLYLINKIEHPEQMGDLGDFYSLGVDKLYQVSAEHGNGMGDFLDDLISVLVNTLPTSESEEEADDTVIKIAIAGRPNVGKSSLANQLFGEYRLIVDETAGTTRDAIKLEKEHKGRKFVLVDTAGIRRKGRVTKKIEKFSILKAFKSFDECDVALILIDASEGITDQDAAIAGYAEERGCGILFLINKWDLLTTEEKNIKTYMEELYQKSKFLAFAPALTISALTGQRCHRIWKEVEEIYGQYSYRINTGQVNRIMEEAIQRNEPSIYKGKRLKFFYTTQISTKPPTFVSFVNFPKGVHFSYKRYLINRLREAIPLEKTPMRLYFREKTGKIEFTDKPQRKGFQRKRRLNLKRAKERKNQSRRKRQRDRQEK
ncbi:MAG: ribosome biogenesis GTPase Der [Desulfobacula sp.]|jgi:GTPase|nr:ribosome biogenesis GTPase Der [Desulfobacula sp.]